MDAFEQINPSPSAFVYSSHLFLLLFLMAIVTQGKELSISVSLRNGTLQKWNILHPSLKIAP